MSFLSPPPPAKPLPQESVDRAYRARRTQVFTGIFIGYAAFYLLRNNFSLAMPHLAETYSKTMLGFGASGMAIAYGLSKFVMGTISDHSNARIFLFLSLLVTAGLTFLAGTPLCLSAIWLIFAFQVLVGWFGACGWPPCGRVMTHWFSLRERGMIIATWNVAHNVGGSLLPLLSAGGIALMLWYYGPEAGKDYWQFGVFYLPAFVAILLGLVAYALIRDTPQSCGLPPVEVYKNDYPPEYDETHEKELSASQIVRILLSTRVLWFAGIACAFIYLVRYGVANWAPTYLKGIKGFSVAEYSWAYGLYEFAAIPGTLLCGWVSDHVFRGRHALTGMVFMGLTLVCILVYWLNPPGHKWIDMVALIAIGFLVYGPVMITGVIALEIAPKKASGSACGMMSFFGYFIGTSLLSYIVMGYLVDRDATWNTSFLFLCGGCVLAILFLAIVWQDERHRARMQKH